MKPLQELSEIEQEAFEKLESAIAASESSAVTYVTSLREIRDRRLYRTAFSTFESYCEARWDKSYRAINLALQADKIRKALKWEAASQLSDKASISLAKIEPKFQKQVLKKAQKDPSGPTSKAIHRAASFLPSYQLSKSLDFSGAYSSTPSSMPSKPVFQQPASSVSAPLPPITNPASAASAIEAIYSRDKAALNSIPPRSPRQLLDHLIAALLQ